MRRRREGAKTSNLRKAERAKKRSVSRYYDGRRAENQAFAENFKQFFRRRSTLKFRSFTRLV